VAVRFLVLRGLPLLVAAVGDEGLGPQVRAALATRGVVQIPGFLGRELPRGARVGFLVDGDVLRLVDEDETQLLRAPRAGVDADWLAAARRLKGTMLLVLASEELIAEEPAAELAQRIEDLARVDRVQGAIVGVVEERPQLPLLF